MAANNFQSLINGMISFFVVLLLATINVYGAPDTEENLLAKLKNAGHDTATIAALLKLSSFYVNKPGNENTDMLKALTYAADAVKLGRQHGDKTSIASAYTITAQIYSERGERESARNYARSAVKIFTEDKKNMLGLANAYLELSNSYTIDSETDVGSKILYYQKGVDLLRKAAPNTLKLADALKFLGDLYSLKEENKTAISFLAESLTIYKSNRYEKVQDIYSMIGAIYSSMGNNTEGMKYLLEATKLADRFKDSSSTVVTLYNRIGIAYNGMNQLENSGKAFKKSLTLAKVNHDKNALLMVASNLSWTYIRLNKSNLAIGVLKNALKNCSPSDTAQFVNLNTTLIEAYVRLNDPKNAQYYFGRIENTVKKFYSYDHLQTNFYNASTKLFLLLKDYNRTAVYLEKFSKISKVNNSLRDLGAAEFLNYKLDSAVGKSWSAIEHYKKFKQYSDSLNQRNHNKELARYQAEFDSDKKDLDIVEKAKDIRLLKQQTALQTRAISSERNARNLLITGVGLLILLLWISYNRYKIKQHANLELERKQVAINQQNLSLKQLLSEREWLLKEVHHRVKNNLQIIISLLDSQSVFLTDDSALGVIRESQHRMTCISLVHQKLYQDDNLSGIEIKEYISELIGYMKDSFSTGTNIKFIQDVDHIILDVSQAVPLGLILNEAITNSIKYAFRGQADCVITVKLKHLDGIIDLLISDNGCGLPSDFDILKCTSLGMNLIHGLARQLGGKLELLDGNGLSISIKLPKLKILKESPLAVGVENVA